MTLEEFFKEHRKLALAFSGGTDSAFLLYSAKKYGCDITAYYCKSEFQPQFELEDAVRLSKELDVPLKVLELSVLVNPDIAANGQSRCYHCKRKIFTTILNAAKMDGYMELMDGTNASDNLSDRPGVKALQELEILSPLRLCGLTKSDVRILSKEAGLFTWDKPAYSCLATRIKTGQQITAEDLHTTEEAESILSNLGFSDFRVRKWGETAVIQIKENQFKLLEENRMKLVELLKPYYANVTLDLEERI